MSDDLPPLNTKLTADITDLETGLAKGDALVTAFRDKTEAGLSGGRAVGEKFGKDLGQGIQDAIPEGFDDNAGLRLGQELAAKAKKGAQDAAPGIGQSLGAGIGDGLTKGVQPGLDDLDNEVKDRAKKTGQDAGAAAGQGMSPLIVSAIAGAVTIGGPLLLAGLGGVMTAATALVLKQNQVISADFAQVGKDAANSIETAAAPLTATLHQDLVAVDSQVNALQPDFKNLFAAAEPDISAVTTGLTGLVGGALPGLAQAVSGSQVIVSDFSKSLPALGSGIGGFFTGLVHNADIQGQALEQTVGTIGHAFQTLGSVIGSASSAASADLLALTPVINGLLTAVNAVSSPATIGGVAGLFGAMKLDPKLQSGLLSGAEGLSKVADKAEEAGGLVGKLSGAAGGASGVLAKMAGVVGGPWGLAIGAGIGLVSGLAAELFHADDATKAITLSTQDLQGAIAQDGATAGQVTSEYVAQQAQLSGLADTAKAAGVSLDTLVQAAIGNRDAQQELSGSVSDANEASRAQQMVSEQTLSGFNNLNSSMATGNDLLVSSAEQTNTLTSANQKLVNSVQAQAQQTADAIEKQAQLNAAVVTLNNATNIFNSTMDADYQKLTAKAQASAQATVATLNLGVAQSGLNQALAGVVQQYNLAADGGNAYGQVLTALNGTTANLLASEAGFTTALGGLTNAIGANGRSLDVNNTKGAANIQVFAGIANSADKAAAAVYESEVNTKGANQAYQDANAKLEQEKNAFIAAADKAGYNKDEVKKLADELYKLPSDIPITITADTGPARQELNGLIQKIDASSATVQIYASPNNATGGKALYDLGGWTKAAPGQPEEAIVHGGEYMLSRDMLAGRQQVDPRVLAAMRSAMAGVGVAGSASAAAGFAPAASGSGSGDVTVIAPVYLDGRLVGQSVTSGSRAGAQQFARHNAITGFASNYN